MNFQKRLTSIRRIDLVIAVAVVTVTAGFLVLIGWQTDSVALKTFGLGTVAMEPFTALGFILAGLALFTILDKRHTNALMLIVASLIGLLALLIIFDNGAGFKNLLFSEKASPAATGFFTGLNFLLLSFSFYLLVFQNTRTKNILEAFLLLIFSMNFFGIIWFLFGYGGFSGYYNYSLMARNTSLVAMVVSFGIYNFSHSKLPFTITIREKLLPALLLTGFAIIFFSFVAISGIESLQQILEQNVLFKDTANSGNTEKTQLILLLSIGFQILFLVVVYYIVHKDFIGRRKAEDDLNRLNSELEYIVMVRTSELRKSEEQYRHLVETAPDIIFTLANDGTFTSLSPAFETISFWQTEEWIGKSFAGLIHPGDLPRLLGIFKKAMMGITPPLFESRALTKNGNYLFFEYLISLLWENGEVVGVMGISRDITARKLAEAESKINETKFRTLFESANDAIFLVDKGIFIDCNSKSEEIFKRSKKEILGHSPVEFSPEKQPDGRLSSEISMGKDIEALNGNPQVFEWVHSRPDGSFFDAEVNLNRIELNGKSLLQAIVRDISERKKSEEKIVMLATAVKNSADCIAITDKDFKIIYVNDSFCKTYDFREEEIVGQPIAAIISKNNPPEIGNQLYPAIAEKKIWTGEILNKRKDGNEFQVFLSIAPIINEAGETSAIVGITRDITEIKQKETEILNLNATLERKVAERTEQLSILNDHLTKEVEQHKLTEADLLMSRDILRNSIDSLYVYDPVTRRLLEVNETACQTLGYTQSELLAMRIDDLDSILPVTQWPAHVEAVKASENGLVYETYHTRKDKTQLPVEVISRYAGIAGKNYMVSTARDITDRLKTEAEVLKSRDDAQEANRSKSEFFSRVSHELRTPLNAILGFSQLLEMGDLNAMQKKSVGQILKGGKHLLGLVNQVLNISQIEDRSLSFSLEPILLKGIITETLDIIRPFAAESNIRLELISPDRSDQYVEADRQKLKQVLLNLMNNAVKYNHQGGSVRVEVNSGQSAVGNGQSAVSSPQSTVDSRLQTEDWRLPTEDRRLPTEDWRLPTEDRRLPTEDRRLPTEDWRLPTEDRGQPTVHSRQPTVDSSLPTEDRRLPTEDRRLPTEDRRLRISITDTGIGISPEGIKRLFHPFERIGNEISEDEGAGLGLAVSKKFMEAMNGNIGVESEPGIGSTFWIELPQVEGQSDFQQHDADSFLPDHGKADVRGMLLYIEDNFSNIQLIEQVLETQRPNIRMITNMYGKNAVKLATDYQPDLILLDLDLPDMHGSEVLATIQANDKTKSIPVVIISADALSNQIANLIKAGAKDYLTKPLNVVDLLRVIDEVMRTAPF